MVTSSLQLQIFAVFWALNLSSCRSIDSEQNGGLLATTDHSSKLISGHPSSPPSGPCHSVKIEDFDAKAQKFVEQKKISDGKAWYPIFVTENNGRCFLILSPIKDEWNYSEVEIVAIASDGSLALVENQFTVPKTLRVAIGNLWTVENGDFVREQVFFYTELNGKSAREAFKSIVARFPVSGLLEGCVEAIITKDSAGVCDSKPTGKLSWDPTPGRKWKLAKAEYSAWV